MATVTRENIGLLNERITVTVNKEDYLPSFEKALKHYAKTANVPGFRKGMVPAGIIRKMHGPAVFTDEVLRSVESGLMNYLQQEQLDIFAQPLPSQDNDARQISLDNPVDYSFHFEIGLKPEFSLPDLGSQPITRYQVTVSDEEVNTEIERMQTRLGKLQEPETVGHEDNILNVTFEAVDADGNPLADGARKENSLLLKYFRESFRSRLLGLKKEDSVLLTLEEAFEDKELSFVAKDLGIDETDAEALKQPFRMTITKIGMVEKRALDESFFQEVYPGKEIRDEAAFRAEVKADMEEQWKGQTRNHLHHELYHVLLDHTHIEFPETFLKRWLQTNGEKPKSAEEVEQEFPSFRNQLKWTLITDKIVKDQSLDVTADEVRHHMKQQVLQYFGQMNLSGNEEWLDEYAERLMKDREQVEGTYRRLLTEKVFEWAESQVNPTNKPVSTEEFRGEMEKHQH